MRAAGLLRIVRLWAKYQVVADAWMYVPVCRTHSRARTLNGYGYRVVTEESSADNVVTMTSGPGQRDRAGPAAGNPDQQAEDHLHRSEVGGREATGRRAVVPGAGDRGPPRPVRQAGQVRQGLPLGEGCSADQEQTSTPSGPRLGRWLASRTCTCTTCGTPGTPSRPRPKLLERVGRYHPT